MSFSIARPHCYVDIYPFEGGGFTIRGDSGAILACDVNTNIRNGYGEFVMTLAPGGPLGPNVSPQWVDIIDVMSLVVIGMERAGRQQIVMIGVVRRVSATEEWVTGQGVQRSIQVTGMDFGYFFQLQNFYTQALLNATVGGPVGQQGALSLADMGLVGPAGPDVVGAAWYNKVMAGPTGIMADTTFAYQGSRVSFFDLVSTYFQPYDLNIQIPFGDNFMSADGTWIDKFTQIFPFPWYEFFVVTAPNGAYPGGLANVPIELSAPGFLPASPQLVARMNPLPWAKNFGSADSLDLQMQFTKWDELPEFQLDVPPISYQISSSDDEVRNYYVTNCLWVSQQFGLTNSNQVPFTWLFSSYVDAASMHKYGFRPDISELHWWYDPEGTAAKQNAGQGITPFQIAVGNLAMKKVSYHEPTPFMFRGSVTTNLRPDILPGNRFLVFLHKDNEPWLFYIEGVNHSYRFGGPATTTVQLSRGLPGVVYDDEDLMLAMHQGNAQRRNGVYQVGLPPGLGKPLQPLNYTNSQAVIGDIAKIFSVPQAK